MSLNKLFCTPNPNINNPLPLLKLDVQNQTSIPPRQNFGAFHWHYDLQFVLVMKGSISVQTLNHEYIVESGNGIFINSCVLHRITEKRNCHYNSFIFPENLLPGFSTGFFSSYISSIAHNKLVECVPLVDPSKTVEELQILNKIDIERYDTDTNFLFIEILIKVWKAFIYDYSIYNDYKKESLSEKQIHMENAIMFIHENYSSNISLNSIAGAAYISKSSLLRYFKETLHTTPYDYLIDFRIKKSIELLENSTLPIIEIANKVGYNSQSQFGKHFKERLDVTPNIYRCMIKKRISQTN